MTQVVFDVVDLVGEVHPGDTVSVWPPHVTATVDGRVQSTRKIDVLVDEGPVTEDIEPGPMVVQLQCRGIVDTKPRTVTIPDEGTITLANLIQSTFTYTPPVVSQVALDAQRAEDAAVRAEAGAATVGDAQAVLDARDDTVAAVATLGDAQTVLTARDQAVTAAEDAEQIATTIQSELDTRVPPLVADAIADDQTVADAAVSALGDAVDGLDLMERTTAEGLIEEALPWRGILPDGTDMNAVRVPGFYSVPYTASAATMINWPTRRAGILKVLSNEGSNLTVQEVTAYVSASTATEQYSRATIASHNTAWSTWFTTVWTQGIFPTGTAGSRVNVDTWRNVGAWAMASTTYVDGLPVPNTGLLEVFAWPDTGLSIQRYTARITNEDLRVYQRVSLSVSGFAGIPWQRVGVTSSGGGGASWGPTILPEGTDLGTFRDPGLWLILNTSSAMATGDMPVDSTGVRVEGPALLEVAAVTTSGRAFQTITVDHNGKLRDFARTTTLVESWPEWQEKGGAAPDQPGQVTDTSTAVSDHAARVEYARSRRGGGIGTSGQAVVMLRFDHWLVAFRDEVLPILRKYQLPATLNLNYDNILLEQNGSGTITWEHVQDWNQRYGIEIANHGSTHRDQTTTEDIYHEIVNGRRNLEAAMPRVAVETWQEHGASYFVNAEIDGDPGLNLGREPHNFFESYAGRLVLAEHAIIEGKAGGFFHPINGDPQIGQSHYSSDRDAAQSMIDLVGVAQALGRGVTFYTHPGSMNNVLANGQNWPYEEQEDGSVIVTNPNDGSTQTFATDAELRAWASTEGHIVHISYKDFDTFCAHLAAERDAGRLMIMTAAGGGFADIKSDHRENLLVKSDFTDGYTSWWDATSGWTITNPGPDVELTSSSSAQPMSQSMLLHSRFGWAMGAAHELLVRVSATVETTLTLRAEQMGNATNWNAGETFTVPGDGVPRDYRLNISLPRDPSITQIRWFLGGPSMTIHGAPLLAAI